MTAKQNPNTLQSPDGSYYVTLTDGAGNLAPASGGGGGGGAVTNAGTFAVQVNNGSNTAQVKAASTAPLITDPSLVVSLSPNSAGIVALGQNLKASSVPVTIASDQNSSPYPFGATPITASTTGTTAATVATLAAAASKTTYICGFTITADATAALAGAATVAGTVSGSLNYIQSVGAATSAQQLTQSFNPPIPSSAVNTAITVTSAAAGTGGNTAVTAWGYQL